MSLSGARTGRRYTLVSQEDIDLVLNKNAHIGNGYVIVMVNGKGVRLHRLVMGAKPGEVVDHANGDKLDNRRFCTATQNNANRPAGKGRRFKGTFRVANGRFTARIVVHYKCIHLGTFDTEEEAARAYDDAAKLHFGEFARLNFPDADQNNRMIREVEQAHAHRHAGGVHTTVAPTQTGPNVLGIKREHLAQAESPIHESDEGVGAVPAPPNIPASRAP